MCKADTKDFKMATRVRSRRGQSSLKINLVVFVTRKPKSPLDEKMEERYKNRLFRCSNAEDLVVVLDCRPPETGVASTDFDG